MRGGRSSPRVVCCDPREEVRAVMLRMGHEVSEDELTRGFEEMDEDGRGNVDYEEFERWWDRRMTAPEIKRLADSRTGANGPCRRIARAPG